MFVSIEHWTLINDHQWTQQHLQQVDHLGWSFNQSTFMCSSFASIELSHFSFGWACSLNCIHIENKSLHWKLLWKCTVKVRYLQQKQVVRSFDRNLCNWGTWHLACTYESGKGDNALNFSSAKIHIGLANTSKHLIVFWPSQHWTWCEPAGIYIKP